MAEAEFDLFITADQNLRYQQNFAERRIAILERKRGPKRLAWGFASVEP